MAASDLDPVSERVPSGIDHVRILRVVAWNHRRLKTPRPATSLSLLIAIRRGGRVAECGGLLRLRGRAA